MKRKPTTNDLANERNKKSRASSALRRSEQELISTIEDLALRQSEQHRITTIKDLALRQSEQHRITTVKDLANERQKRARANSDPDCRRRVQDLDTLARACVRLDPDVRERDNLSNRRGRKNATNSWDKVLHEFQQCNKEGPTHICCCCGGLFFIKSIQTVYVEVLLESGCNRDFLIKVLHLWDGLDPKVLLCCTCRSGILNNKVIMKRLIVFRKKHLVQGL
jgi:hypothetical protein